MQCCALHVWATVSNIVSSASSSFVRYMADNCAAGHTSTSLLPNKDCCIGILFLPSPSYQCCLRVHRHGRQLYACCLQILTIYGQYVLRIGQTSHPYTEKYKGIWLSLTILTKALAGNYVNFGVFDLYGDPALKVLYLSEGQNAASSRSATAML